MKDSWTARVTLRLVATIAVLASAACGKSKTTSEGEVSRSWNPLGVREVRDIPVATIKAEIDKQLSAKDGQSSTEDQRRHAKRLYAAYQNAPLWLDDDGVLTKRVHALVDAMVNATTDAIDIEQYPLIPLAVTLDSLDHNKHPSAEQLARADVMLTTSYVALSEDYLTGQVDPSTVSQSLHIDPQE